MRWARTCSGIYAYNGGEYVESMLGAFRARVAPFNVNYRYVKSELQYLLADSGATALVYHAAFAPRVAEVLPDLPQLRVLIQIADDSGNDLLYGAVDYEIDRRVERAQPPPVGAGIQTTSTSCTPAARRVCPKACCGASTTFSWPPSEVETSTPARSPSPAKRSPSARRTGREPSSWCCHR